MLFKKYLTPWSSIILIALLALGFGVMRALGALGPSHLRWMLPLGFCLMAILPWVLLSVNGRRQMGLKQPEKKSDYLTGIGCGIGSAFLCFLLGFILFGHSPDNWFANIGNTYKTMMNTTGMPFWMLHLVFTIPAMLFSPIGEEIFFRGILQKTLEQKWSVLISTLIECSLFGVVHLCHHGFIKASNGLEFLPISGALWVIQMFFVAWMFAWLRAKSGSIFVAILAHSFFNLTMNFFIFGFLW